MISDAYRELLATHLEAENDHRLEDTLATLTEDCVFDDRALGRVFRGREGAGEYYRMWWEAFGQTVHTEHHYYPEPELAVVETRFRGTHVGDFLGIAPTGRDIDLPIAIFIDLKDGLMAGERFYWDRATLMSQLGVERIPAT